MRVVDTYRNTTLSADGRLDERSQGDQAAHTCFMAIELASQLALAALPRTLQIQVARSARTSWLRCREYSREA
jgi:hypothetical protein